LKYQNIALSFIIVVCWASVILFITANGQNDLREGLSIYSWITATRYCGLLLGFAALLLRLLKQIKQTTGFFYSFSGILNLGLILAAVVLSLTRLATASIFFEFWPNLVIALFILGDTFLL
jgi:hypothetical protein